MNLEQRLKPHPDVSATAVDDDATALLHLGSEMLYSLNATGTRIWRYLRDGETLGQISERLQEQCGIEAELAQRSVLELATDLAEHRLVEPWNEGAHSHRRETQKRGDGDRAV